MMEEAAQMNIKRAYAFMLMIIIKLFGVDRAKIFDTLLRDHKKLNLSSPKTLSEKVSYIELHAQSPLASICTDKYAVRDYVKSKGLEEILIPVYGTAYTCFEDINLSVLPNKFVIKATHGCKMNYIVRDKACFEPEKCKKEIERWMNTTYGTYSMEPHYISIPHRFYIEQYLNQVNELIDYKFHCLNGEPCFVLTCSDRHTNGDAAMQVTLGLYDMKWNPIPEIIPSRLEKPGTSKIPKPRNFDKMTQIAKILSKEFKFVRVDLYECDNKVYFGELTFTPAHCVFPYFTNKFDLEMGKILRI